jgi:thiol-disulfide isomerase/thioredoxin
VNPYGDTHPYWQIASAIDDESSADPKKALDWSKERYEILLARSQTPSPDIPPLSYEYVLNAGHNLVHRYYLAGETSRAVRVLDDMNSFVRSNPSEANGWGADDLHWANLEMQPAPGISVLKLLGRRSRSRLIEPGRVEVLSFFFLGCSPCIGELPDLNALQKRYGTEKLLVTDVTTYELNSYLTPSTHSHIEGALEKIRAKKASDIGVVITSDETLAHYGIRAFPGLAIVDKMGRLRYIGRDINLDDDDPVGQLIRKLVEE